MLALIFKLLNISITKYHKYHRKIFPLFVEAHQLSLVGRYFKALFFQFFSPPTQSETMELSSQQTRSLAIHMTPRTTKHIFSKKIITRNISSKNYPTSQHVETSQPHPSLHHHFLFLFIKFTYPLA
jgi:hypothetical protein